MVKTIMGLVLIDAPFSALNNQGADEGDRTENIVRTKVIWRGKKRYPYVSGQAVRYWWRTTLASEKKWKLSPIEREKKIAFTAADPVNYPDDDVFGYMKAPKGRGKETLTRVSPLKTSPLISAFPAAPVSDFGVMSRHEGDPVPYEHEFYSTILKGIFSLDLDSLGRFYRKKRSGLQNLGSEIPAEMMNQLSEVNDSLWELSVEERKKRAKEVIEVLPYLYGGAKLASHLTDISPKFIMLGVFNTGNHVLYHSIGEGEGKPTFSVESVKQVLNDFGDRLLSPLFIGRHEGFMDEWASDLKQLSSFEGADVKVVSVKEAVDGLSKFIQENDKLFS